MIDVYKMVVLFFLSIIEGLTEFIPISSMGHMMLCSALLNCMDDSMKVFMITVQFGAILSVIIIFRARLYYFGKFCLIDMFMRYDHNHNNHLCVQHILLGTAPGVVLGAIYYEKFRLIFAPIFVVYGLIVGGIFLLIGEMFFYIKKPSISNIDNITYLQAFLIGCFQCLALWPGFSRSGATIGGGLIIGLNRCISSEFSFILGIPIILGSIGVELFYCRYDILMTDILFLVMGCMVSFIVSFFVINFFLKIIKNVSLIPFVIYRILLACGVYYGMLI